MAAANLMSLLGLLSDEILVSENSYYEVPEQPFPCDDAIASFASLRAFMKIKVVDQRNKNYNIFTNALKDCYFQDEYSAVILNRRISSSLGVKHGDLLSATLVHSKEGDVVNQDYTPSLSCKKIVAVISNEGKQSESLNDSACVIMPTLLFNLNMTLQSPYCQTIFQHSCCKLQITKEPGGANIEELKHATQIVISCINSPSYDSLLHYDYLLKLYFAKTRFLQIGDIFALKTEDDPDYCNFLHGELNARNTTVYFKVQNMLPRSGLLVKFVNTVLLQDRSVQSFIPPLSSLIPCSNRNLLDAWGDKGNAVCNAILPFLNFRKANELMSPLILLVGSYNSGLSFLCRALADVFCLHFYSVNCDCIKGQTSAIIESKLKHIFNIASKCSPCLLFFENMESICKDHEGNDDVRVTTAFNECVQDLRKTTSDWPVVVIASASSLNHIAFDIQKHFLHILNLENPEKEHRLNLIKLSLGEKAICNETYFENLTHQTGGMNFDQLQMCVTLDKWSAFERGHSLDCEMPNFESGLQYIHSLNADSLASPKIPRVTWTDIGGLEHAKQDILDTIQLPMKNPSMLHAGLRRSGILLFGPPGTGKTLLAKAIASECSLNFMSVKGPELLNMYVGQSEENIREIFSKARSSSPCIVFFDELDSLAPKRGRTGDSGGVMDRVVSQLLTELDGINRMTGVFVIGATNRPDLIDTALLRPGRFDKLVYLGIDENKHSQLKIVKALTRKFVLEERILLERIVEKCPSNLTGADFYALCSEALMFATEKCVEFIKQSHNTRVTEEIVVKESDFCRALEAFTPTLTFEELDRYNKLKEHFCSLNT